MSGLQVVGTNNAYQTVRYNKSRPLHESHGRDNETLAEPSILRPGQRTKVKLDLLHSGGREVVINDLRLRWKLKCPEAAQVAWLTRGTDLIRYLCIKMNNQVVYETDVKGMCSLLWESNVTERLNLEDQERSGPYFDGNIPDGLGVRNTFDASLLSAQDVVDNHTRPFENALDYQMRPVWCANPGYAFDFSLNLSQIVDGLFTRFHSRRIETIEIGVEFNGFVSNTDSQSFIYFKGGNESGFWGDTEIHDVRVQLWKSTFLSGGVPPPVINQSIPLLWTWFGYSRREYPVDLTNESQWRISLSDWEVRSNISRVCWMLAPADIDGAYTADTAYCPMLAGPHDPSMAGAVLKWRNDEVLELLDSKDVNRHYSCWYGKRSGAFDPRKIFPKLMHGGSKLMYDTVRDDVRAQNGDPLSYSNTHPQANRFDMPWHFIEFNSNTKAESNKSRLIEGISNHTSDYQLIIKRLSDVPIKEGGERTLWVWLEYCHGAELNGGSDFTNKASQVITKIE